MNECITCKWYTHKETADGMIRKCVLDDKIIYPTSTCDHYECEDI